MRANRQALVHPFATATTLLGGICGRDRFCSLASVHCFAREEGQKLRSARVIDRLVETRFSARPVGQIPSVAVRLGLRALRLLVWMAS